MRDDDRMPIRDTYEPGRPCWVDLATSDPAAARSFYGDLFGWTADVDPRSEAGGYAQFTHDDHAVAGVGPMFTEGMPPAWMTYIASADVEKTAATIAANGGTVLQAPLDVLDAGRMVVFAGPDGAVAGLWQPGEHKGAAFVNEAGGWSWSQLMTRDKDAAVAFYEAVFDWRLRTDPDWGEHLALGEEGGEIGGATQIGDELPPEVPSHWQVRFMVDDTDTLVGRAEGLGGTVLGPVEDMNMGGRVASLADPQGATFGVLSFANPSW